MARTGDRLFKELNVIAAPAAESVIAPKKGRSKALISERDQQLIHRYYYHTYINQKKLEAVLKALQQEFHLTTPSAMRVIAMNSASLKEMFKSKPTVGQLIKKYPHFAWSISTKSN